MMRIRPKVASYQRSSKKSHAHSLANRTFDNGAYREMVRGRQVLQIKTPEDRSTVRHHIRLGMLEIRSDCLEARRDFRRMTLGVGVIIMGSLLLISPWVAVAFSMMVTGVVMTLLNGINGRDALNKKSDLYLGLGSHTLHDLRRHIRLAAYFCTERHYSWVHRTTEQAQNEERFIEATIDLIQHILEGELSTPKDIRRRIEVNEAFRNANHLKE